MPASWVVHEMETVHLNDRRLNARLVEVLSQLADQPAASIPTACGGHAEMTAAYRLFDNEKATFEQILRAHSDATRRRIAAHPVILLVQDTTEVDVTRPEQQVVGAGPLDGQARHGALLHVMHAFAPDGTPLGTISGVAWARADGIHCASLTRSERASMPIEDKESHRWVEMLRCAAQEAQHAPSAQLICVADSESDIYEVLAEGSAEPRPVDWIVRACQNRALQSQKGLENSEKHIREHLLNQPVLFTHCIHVRGRKAKIACETRGRRQPRQSREAKVAVRAARVALRPPWRGDRRLPEVSINVVLVREIDPPANDEPVEWILLTSLPVDRADAVRRIIQYYCARWMIELFFRVLKSGCRVEERRFEHIDRLLSCVAVYLIVAWRTLYVCRLGRANPSLNCEAVFDPAEWKSVWTVIRRAELPTQPPTLDVMIRMVAQLGGYVPRKRGHPPGPQTVWIGLQRTHDFALCWRTFGPGSTDQPKLV
ncbi:MAG: IS4 family transposase [Phycisphaerales bacterium]|nr:IS4 family transposase [Phycisphaerales bacterium]